MKLFAVIVGGVYPRQCVVVWDREESARLLSDHLNSTISPKITVETVDSFFPSGMTNADAIWVKATESYLRGDHHNTSG